MISEVVLSKPFDAIKAYLYMKIAICHEQMRYVNVLYTCVELLSVMNYVISIIITKR